MNHDHSDGLDLKEQGMGLALTREDIPPWRERFEAVVYGLKPGTYFTSEDILETEGVGLPSDAIIRDGNNAVGAVMNALSKAGAMVKSGQHVTSRRKNSHGAELTLWVRA